MVLRAIAILVVGTALAAGVQYGVGAQHRTSDSVEANSMASTFNLNRESSATVNHARGPAQTMESASVGTAGDNAHIDQIRRAHAAIRYGAVSDQPPTF
jgi:Tfp pilus assembly protein PilV